MIRKIKIKKKSNSDGTGFFDKVKKNKLASATIGLFLITIILSPFYISDSYADYSAACSSASFYPKDSNVARHIMSRVYYTNSCSATACTVYCISQGGIYKDNLGATITGTTTMGGIGSNSGTHTYTYSSGGTSHTATYYNMGSGVSYTFSRGTSAGSVACSSYVYKSNGSASYGQGKGCTASVTISIPALDYYTVSYNCNSGEGCPATGGHYHGSTYTVPSDVPTRTNYTFDGYKYGTATCNPGSACTFNENITLTAQWTGIPYQIKFDKNGGAGTDMANLSMNYGTAKNLTANTYTKSGNNFVGWNTAADGSGTEYDNGASVNNLTTTANDVVTLYAQWEAATPYTLTIDSHGGTIPETEGWTISGDTATKLVYYDHAYGDIPTPEKVGYTFKGWSYVDGTTYKPLSYISGTGTQYIDTNYKPKSNTGVAVRYGFNEVDTLQQRVYGVEGLDSDTSSMSYSYYINGAGGMSYAYKDGEGNWVQTGYTADTSTHTFKFNVKPGYWSMDKGNNTSISGTVSRTAKYNMALFAAKVNDGTVGNYGKVYVYYFDIYESGAIIRSYVPCYRVSDGVVGLCDVLASTTTFYQNAGTGTFNSDKSLEGGSYFYAYVTKSSPVHIAKNHTLHAIYTVNPLVFPDKTLTVGYSNSSQTVNVEAATEGSGNTTYTKESGESNITVSSAGVITIPASKAAGTYTLSIKATDAVTGATKTATYTIVVKNVFTVKFNSNGGVGTMENQQFLFDESKYLSDNEFTKTGYNFIGWNTAADASGTWYMAENKVKNLSSTNLATVNLYAQWTEGSDATIVKDGAEMYKDSYGNYIYKNKMAVPYTIKYHGNGGYDLFGYDERLSISDKWTQTGDRAWKSAGSKISFYWATYNSVMTSKTFTLTSTETLTFQWAVSTSETYNTGLFQNYGGVYYTITKDGETMSDTGESTRILGGSSITDESELTYSTVTKSLSPGTYTVTFTYKSACYTDGGCSYGLNQAFVKNFQLSSTDLYMSDQSFAADEEKALTANEFMRPGYEFLGWAESSSATVPTYEDEEVVTLLSEERNGTIDLYAVWERNPSYTVNVTVINGTVVGDSSKTVLTGSNGIFELSPNTEYGYYKVYDNTQVGSTSCTNNHSAIVSADSHSVSIGKGRTCYYGSCSGTDEGVQNDTTCTITFKRVSNYSYTSSSNSSYYSSSCCGSSWSFSTDTGLFTVTGTVIDGSHDTSAIGKYCVSDYGTHGASCTSTSGYLYYYTGCTEMVSTSDSNQCGCSGILCNSYISYTQYTSSLNS